MSKRADALAISKEVKDAVWARDGHQCIVCHSPYAFPDSHYIRRSHGGLGIEENIVTMCRDCHQQYDQGPLAERRRIAKVCNVWLRMNYPNWDESKLTYRKDM